MKKTVKLPLTKGCKTIIDAEDYHFLSQWKWSATVNGTKVYAVRNNKGKRVYLHRELLKSKMVDHINNDSLDNRKINLRPTSKSGNAANSDKTSKPKTSKYKGVHWHKQIGRWRAIIHVAGERKSLGCYRTEVEAWDAYNKAAQRYFGEFARLSSKSNRRYSCSVFARDQKSLAPFGDRSGQNSCFFSNS